MEDKEILYKELDSSIKKQIKKLENLDIYTKAHVYNVPKIVKKICDKLGMDDALSQFCIECTFLHDVGKIFISPEILQKESGLTEEEFNILKQHTILGYDLCLSISDLVIYSLAARSHHENVNGSGYPDRLKYNEIPLEAEIIKVADIYDALTSKRQYKDKFSRIESIKIMQEEKDKGNIDAYIFKTLIQVIINDINVEIAKSDIEEEIELQQEKMDIIRITNK